MPSNRKNSFEFQPAPRYARRWLAILSLAMAFTFTARASAQQVTTADREAARKLMDEGDKKRDTGDMKGALKDYEAADTIMKVPTTTLEVARAQAALGQLLEARETLARLMSTTPAPKEPAPFTAARKSAETMNEELAEKIPTLEIVIAGAEDRPTEIFLDGERISETPSSPARPINPGIHVIVVKSGNFEKSLEVHIIAYDRKVITVEVEEPPPVAVMPPPEPITKRSRTAATTLTIGGFGLAAVGLGVGAVTGWMSLSKTGNLKDSCPNNQCSPDKQREIDDAKMLGNVSTATFIAGGVGAAAGVAGLVLLTRQSSEKGTTARSTPRRTTAAFAPTNVRSVIGASYVGIAGSF